MPITIGKGSSGRDEGPLTLLLECHGRIRHFIALAGAVGARSDLAAAEVVDACADVSRYFREALPLHVRDEEESLRPRLIGLNAALDQALETMTAEHDEHRSDLELLLGALASRSERPSDDGARAELQAVASRLNAAFEEHLLLEERAIFPEISALDQVATAAITTEIRARRRSG